MSAKRSKDSETGIDESTDAKDNSNNISLNTKLERRRRIEELNEEKRLYKELNEF